MLYIPYQSDTLLDHVCPLLTVYSNYHVLLFRPRAIENLSPAETERDIRARTAADSITRLAEDLLAACTIRSAQVHLYGLITLSNCLYTNVSPASLLYLAPFQSIPLSSVAKTPFAENLQKTNHDNVFSH